jgi:hypothetical protein
METTRKFFVALAVATTGRNCVAASEVILANFNGAGSENKCKKLRSHPSNELQACHPEVAAATEGPRTGSWRIREPMRAASF